MQDHHLRILDKPNYGKSFRKIGLYLILGGLHTMVLDNSYKFVIWSEDYSQSVSGL